MKQQGILIIVLAAIAGMAHADDLCRINPYTKSEAQQGKVAFDSHCALCHQYNMTGRVPGNTQSESPSFDKLSASDVSFVDNAGGSVPPLVGPKFFSKQGGKSLAEFSAFVSGAANTFPATKMVTPQTYFELAAYVLYRNCGKM
jgi:mono/diheme cytochrome c family protein